MKNSQWGQFVTLFFIGMVCLGAAFLTGGMWGQSVSDRQAGTLASLEPATGETPALMKTSSALTGEFELIDHDGKTVTKGTYDGKYRMVFFGFANCPAVCPGVLQRMTSALEIMGDDAKKIQPIFVSTDPERDTPEIMKEYVALFSPDLIGLTGSEDQINAAKDTFKVYAEKVFDEDLTDYLIDHSAYIYFMNAKGDLITILGSDEDPADMAKEMKDLMSHS